jgi:hypothetical protein
LFPFSVSKPAVSAHCCLLIRFHRYPLIQLIYCLTVSTWDKMAVRIDRYLDAAMA